MSAVRKTTRILLQTITETSLLPIIGLFAPAAVSGSCGAQHGCVTLPLAALQWLPSHHPPSEALGRERPGLCAPTARHSSPPLLQPRASLLLPWDMRAPPSDRTCFFPRASCLLCGRNCRPSVTALSSRGSGAWPQACSVTIDGRMHAHAAPARGVDELCQTVNPVSVCGSCS